MQINVNKHNYLDAIYASLGCKNIGDTLHCGDSQYSNIAGVWTAEHMIVSAAQAQTQGVFAHKWEKESTFNSSTSRMRMRAWLIEKYGDVKKLMETLPNAPLVLDAGCGAAMSALEFFEPVLNDIRYIGLDVSQAVHVARKRIQQAGFEGVFFQDDISHLPFEHGSVDCIFSEGVLHHTNSTKGALEALVPLLRSGGLFLFYVYRKKGPIREFTDDYIREKVQRLTPEEAWMALKPLTELGIQLGKIDHEISFPDGFPLLDIPAGKVSLQRFFYWHICKAYFAPELNFDEMHHINFDWFAPQNAFRQSPEEVQSWCEDTGLNIERFHVEPAGITVVGRKL